MLRLFRNVWLILTVDCEQSAFLVSRSFDQPLTWSEAIAVWMHCLICSKSRRLSRQLSDLDWRLNRGRFSSEVATLSDAARQRIAAAINSELD